MSVFPSSIDVGLGHVAYFGQRDVGIIKICQVFLTSAWYRLPLFLYSELRVRSMD